MPSDCYGKADEGYGDFQAQDQGSHEKIAVLARTPCAMPHQEVLNGPPSLQHVSYAAQLR